MKKVQYNTKEIIEILENFEGKIQKILTQTIYRERDDLAQEIRLKIIEKLNTLEFSQTPSFWSFIENSKSYQD
jgi:ribosome maturation factor RimP